MIHARWRRLLGLLGLLVVLDLVILGLGWLLHGTVVPGWKKGPLIDPAAPYAPEQAILIFSWALAGALDLYVILLALSRSLLRLRWWVPWVALFLSLFAAEAGIRVWISQHMLTYFRPHPVLHWVVRSNLEKFENRTGGAITTNDDGMREVKVARKKDPGVFRVLVLGDSSAFGQGVEGNEMFSSVLQELLRERASSSPAGVAPSVEVLNGACPGWTTWQAVQFLESTGLKYHPDLVIAGFNNDPGPDYFGDAARAPSAFVRLVEEPLFRLEFYLVGRETLLSTVRRLLPAPDVAYTARLAGTDPKYGKLDQEESNGLVPRVALDESMNNLRELQRLSKEAGAGFVWLDMPINRLEPELVSRYVHPTYREKTEVLARELGFPLVGIDARWSRSREAGLHQTGHVFHPNARGHHRLAEQLAARLLEEKLVPGLTGAVEIAGPPVAPDLETLRFGWSSLTPVHAHIGLVLEQRPELALKHGLKLDLHAYASGGEQSKDTSRGLLDAFFTCELPAVEMLTDRPDVRLVASPGSLGRIAVVARRDRFRTLADLNGSLIGISPGSTPAMDWDRWGAGLKVSVVPLKTDAMYQGLMEGKVDALVSWDPWVEDWIQKSGGVLGVVQEREFRSVIALGLIWAAQEPERARKLVALVLEAMEIAASDRPYWDAEVARLSGWPLEVVKAVADRNEILAGHPSEAAARMALNEADRDSMSRAVAFLGRRGLDAGSLFGAELLDGKVPALRAEGARDMSGMKGQGMKPQGMKPQGMKPMPGPGGGARPPGKP